MLPRELVYRTLEFNCPERVPRQMWTLPWAYMHFGDSVKAIECDFPMDITGVDGGESERSIEHGDPYEVGEYVDPWGAKFHNVQRGVFGEVKEPLIVGENWEDAGNAHIPYELLTIDKEHINRQCGASDKFIMAGACPRPFEQLQFLRGSENLYLDLAYRPTGMFGLIEKMHDFYCRWVEAWA